jgi:hypothetical protein
MADPRQVTDEDLVVYRVQARALAKKLRRQAAAGELACAECGTPLTLDGARVLLLQCGHELLVIGCGTEGCPAREGAIFEPPGWPDHSGADPGVALPIDAWLKL